MKENDKTEELPKTQGNSSLVKYVNTIGLEQDTAKMLKERFAPFFEQTAQWNAKAKELVVTSVTQTSEMKMAGVARKALKSLRVEADKLREDLKRDSLNYGRAVQGVYNLIEAEIKPTEDYLKLQEDFIIIQEQNRKAELKIRRSEMLQPVAEFVPFAGNLEDMSDEAFDKLLESGKILQEAKAESDRQAAETEKEKERILALEKERRASIGDLWRFFPAEWMDECLGELTVENWNILVDKTMVAKAEYEKEQQRIADENERLKRKSELQVIRYNILKPVEKYGTQVDMMKLTDIPDAEFEQLFTDKNSAYNLFIQKQEKEKADKDLVFEQRKQALISKGFVDAENKGYHFTLSGIWTCLKEHFYNLTDAEFDQYMANIQEAIDNDIERRLAVERKQLQDKRLTELLPYSAHGVTVDMTKLFEMTDAYYREVLSNKKLAYETWLKVTEEQQKQNTTAKQPESQGVTDAEKLEEFAKYIETMAMPDVQTPSGKTAVNGIKNLLTKVAAYVRTKAKE
ncbi:MAG: hypothetical protein ACOYMF_06140 [Bacteroidales bacterium]